jgi:hypothetical protein
MGMGSRRGRHRESWGCYVKIIFDKTRCIECEEAALEVRKSNEEVARQYEEEQMIFSVLVMFLTAAMYGKK